jgi:putative photosynthetic complex assembly protein
MSHHHGGFVEGPIPGLPGPLPEGETLLWQGSPDWKRLALTAMHVRLVAAWFAVLLIWSLASGGGTTGLVGTLVAAGFSIGILAFLAWAMARATIYTITSKRVVMRYGVALEKCINIPFRVVKSAGLRRYADGTGDLPLQLALQKGDRRGWAVLWARRARCGDGGRHPVPRAACRPPRWRAAAGPGGPAAGSGAGAGGRRRMSRIDTAPFPRLPLYGAVGVVLFSLLMVGSVRLGLIVPVRASAEQYRDARGIEPLYARDLLFVDAPDGSVVVREAGSGAVIHRIPAGSENGFVRGVMRGLARERRMKDVGAEPPFRVTLWTDNELTLTDLATGREIDLNAFGRSNREAFLVLLPEAVQADVKALVP